MDSRRLHLKLDPHHYIYSHYQFCVFPETKVDRVLNGNGILYTEDAVQLNLYTSQYPTCPICLDDIALPRLTSCGHLYCWKCLLQFFVLCPAPHKCPVCNAYIYTPFTVCNIIIQPEIHLGDEITMQLMKIPKGWYLPSSYIGETITSPISSKHSMMKFHHVVVEEDPVSVLAREQLKITQLMANPEEQEYLEYYIMMKDQLVDIKKEWLKRCSKTKTTVDVTEWNMYYQDSLGRSIYLIPFNHNMLMEMGSKLTSFTSRIIQVDEEDVGLSEKKTNKIYQHIPFGTEIKLVEVDLKGIVTNAILSKYIGLINKRDNARKQKIEMERRRREEDERRERERIEQTRRMYQNFIYVEDDIELYRKDKQKIEEKYFPALGNNKELAEKKYIPKKKRTQQSLFPSLGMNENQSSSSTSSGVSNTGNTQTETIVAINANNQTETKQFPSLQSSSSTTSSTSTQSQTTSTQQQSNTNTNTNTTSSGSKKKNTNKKSTKKSKKSRRNKINLGDEFLGVYGDDLPPQPDYDDD